MGISDHLTLLLRNLYAGPEATYGKDGSHLSRAYPRTLSSKPDLIFHNWNTMQKLLAGSVILTLKGKSILVLPQGSTSHLWWLQKKGWAGKLSLPIARSQKTLKTCLDRARVSLKNDWRHTEPSSTRGIASWTETEQGVATSPDPRSHLSSVDHHSQACTSWCSVS